MYFDCFTVVSLILLLYESNKHITHDVPIIKYLFAIALIGGGLLQINVTFTTNFVFNTQLGFVLTGVLNKRYHCTTTCMSPSFRRVI